MTNFVLAYTGGKSGDTPEEQQTIMSAWTAWMQGLGDNLVDAGNPFAGSASIAADGSTSDSGRSGLSGYSIVSADDLAAATVLAKDCPQLASGGAIEVYEVFPVM
jgi:YCII-related domain